MADVILVQPKLGYMDSIRTKPFLPLGLISSATLIAQEYDVVLIDQRMEGWQTKLKNELKKNPLCVATTAITGSQIKHALEISRFVKANSESKMIWGGIHASILPRQTLRNENVDIVIEGEGEITLYELVKSLKKENKEIRGIKGTYCKNKNKITANKPRGFVNLDKLPGLPYRLVDIRDYMPLYQGKKSVSIQSSRGCIHQCAYCYNTPFNKGCWRPVPVKKVIEQMNFLVENGAENLYFVDDNFFVDLKRGMEIAKEIKKIGVNWGLQGVTHFSLKKMNKDHLEFLGKTNLGRMSIGIESGSERIRQMIGKLEKPKELIELNKKLSKFNIILYYTFMMGFPTETEAEIMQTVNLLFRLLKDNKNARNSPIYNLMPYPGTKILEIAKEHGFKEPQSLEGWANYEHHNVNVPYIKDKEKFKRIYFSSIFLDNKFDEYNTSFLFKMFSRIYRPIARYRLKHQFFDFMIAKKMADVFMNNSNYK